MIYLRLLSLLALLCSLTMPLAAQSRYRPGYFKDHQGRQIAAQLAYGDYLDARFMLRYRLKGMHFVISSDSLSEAGFGQTPFFTQLPVLTDLSGLGRQMDKDQQIFPMRVEGQSATAALYSYREGGRTRYALRSGNGPVLRLIKEDGLFIEQLNAQLPQKFSSPLKYKRNALRAYVQQYVQEQGDSLQVSLPRPLKGLPWVLWISPGIVPGNFRLGTEADLFPSGNRHWALSMRLGTQTLSSPREGEKRDDLLFSTGMGVRYYQHADIVDGGMLILQAYVDKNLNAFKSVPQTYMDTPSSWVFGGGIALRYGRVLVGYDLRVTETTHGLFYFSWAVADRSASGERR